MGSVCIYMCIVLAGYLVFFRLGSSGVFVLWVNRVSIMLVIWRSQLSSWDQCYLVRIDPCVCFWPCSWSRSGLVSVPVEWWISFSSSRGILWLLDRGESSSVIYRS